MNSPNEPGAPKKGDSPNGDGSTERTGAHRATPGPTGRARMPETRRRGSGGRPGIQPGVAPAPEAPTEAKSQPAAAYRRTAEPLHIRDLGDRLIRARD